MSWNDSFDWVVVIFVVIWKIFENGKCTNESLITYLSFLSFSGQTNKFSWLAGPLYFCKTIYSLQLKIENKNLEAPASYKATWQKAQVLIGEVKNSLNSDQSSIVYEWCNIYFVILSELFGHSYNKKCNILLVFIWI